MDGHFAAPAAGLRVVGTWLLGAGMAAWLALLPRSLPAADAAPPEPAAPRASAMLQLSNHDFVAGQLADSPAGQLRWRSPIFSAPLSFPTERVELVQFPAPAQPGAIDAEYQFELAGGDMLLGRLASSDGECLVIDLPAQQGLHVERTAMRRIVRWQAELIFAGLQGLAGWEAIDPAKPWRAEGSRLATAEKGAGLRRTFALPAQSCFDIELAWDGDANFDLALATGKDEKSVAHAFRFEVQGASLVMLRETADQADIAKVQELKPGAGRVQLRVLLDQPGGRLLACSAEGKLLAELRLADKAPVLGGVQLVNKGKQLRLERLSISRWNGEAPTVVAGAGPRAQTVDGTVLEGNLRSYDAEKRQFVLEGAVGERRIDAARLREIVLTAADAPARRACAAMYHSGARVSGELEKVEQGTVWIRSPGIRESVESRVEDLHLLSAEASRAADAPAAAGPQPQGWEGRLEADGTRLLGTLVDGSEARGGALVWRATLAAEAVPLARGIAGRIVYREPPPASSDQAPPPRSGRSTLGRMIDWVAGVDPDSLPKRKPGAAVLHLRSGDTLAVRVSRIDERGVTFASDSAEATFVPHEQIQALELLPDARPVQIVKPKKERLLTLPRMQRDSPPTHLIRAASGDYLRGRLLAMDDNELQVEIRLETRTVPRANVARILWLHPEAEPAAPAGQEGETPAPRVQALTRGADGLASRRLTFFADELSGATLSGHSDLLGKCQVDLKQVDQLLIGAAIEQAASMLAFHQWKLKAAPEPRGADEAGPGGEGLESVLVGKPAPEAELDLLDGKPFRIADYKGKVLVLDFWASWCGPCLQTMPLVDKVAQEFADQDVRLVGINLAEEDARVKQTLERLELKMPVALDRDGRTAEKYGATAIPQTVIIDRTGKVARLFVGGSARFDEQLREALRAVLKEPAANAAQ